MNTHDNRLFQENLYNAKLHAREHGEAFPGEFDRDRLPNERNNVTNQQTPPKMKDPNRYDMIRRLGITVLSLLLAVWLPAQDTISWHLDAASNDCGESLECGQTLCLDAEVSASYLHAQPLSFGPWLDGCVEEVGTGALALRTLDWQGWQGAGQVMIVGFYSDVPIQVQGVYVTHHSTTGGPNVISYSGYENYDMPTTPFLDSPVGEAWEVDTVNYYPCIDTVTWLGTQRAWFLLHIQAHGAPGEWTVDEIVMQVSPCEPVGIATIAAPGRKSVALPFDAAGRAVKLSQGMPRTIVTQW